MKETINWHTPRKLPKVDKNNILPPYCIMGEKVSMSVGKAFHPVMFVVKEKSLSDFCRNTKNVIAGRYFPQKVEGRHWWSLQSTGFYDREISYWAEVPKGPNANR